jgi:basic membrane protein A
MVYHIAYGYTPAVIMDKNFLSKEDSYIKVGLDAVGSFNKKYNTNVPILTSDSLIENREEFLIRVAKSEYNPIISISFLFGKEVEKVSKMFPKKIFVVLDGNIKDSNNILSINFKEEEGSFIVGAIAALKSKSGVVGFIGGMDVPVIKSFGCGFAQGVKYINPKAKILVEMVGDDHTAFNNPKKAKQIAQEMIEKGADVIYHAADRSGKGLIKAAIENDIYAVGVDFNQNPQAPGYILTSMLKRLDVAIYKVLLDSLNNQLSTDDIVLGLKEKGVSWSLDKYNIDLIDKKSLDRIEEIEFNVIHNIIDVEDYVKEQKCSYFNFD